MYINELQLKIFGARYRLRRQNALIKAAAGGGGGGPPDISNIIL